jgi:hypothetical protein
MVITSLISGVHAEIKLNALTQNHIMIQPNHVYNQAICQVHKILSYFKTNFNVQ